MIGSDPVLSVSEFVAVFNQSLEMLYPSIGIVGELANFRVSKGRWVFFDLKDENSSVRFFGTTSMLPGPLEDGLNLEVFGQPRLHPQYGFSVNISRMKVAGEGSIAKAQALLAKKLESEGLFNEDRKRPLAYPPARIGLITSLESAAYADFIKIINHRWGRIQINTADCLVQGIEAPSQLVSAIEFFNQMADPPEILVIIRGGGSADDLSAFSTEPVVRAVAGSRLPTLVAIGHEVDISLAELAADKRASTPSNAAELLVPDRIHERQVLDRNKAVLYQLLLSIYSKNKEDLAHFKTSSYERLNKILVQNIQGLEQKTAILRLLNPELPLNRGFALVRSTEGQIIRTTKQARQAKTLKIDLSDGRVDARVLEGSES